MSNDPRVARTRARVLAAAWTLLEKHGRAAVTHLRVAKESGVGRASIYRHWPTTDLLVGETLVFHDFKFEFPTEGSAREQLFEHLVILSRHLHSPLAETLFSVLITPSPAEESERRRQQAMSFPMDRLRSVFLAGQRSGELDPSLKFDIAIPMLLGPLFFRRMVMNKAMKKKELRTLLEHVLGPDDAAD